MLLLACVLLPALSPGAAGAAAGADSSIAFPPARVRAWQVGPARPDRLQHASLSFTLAAGATAVTHRPLPSFAGALAVGLAKELWDGSRTAFDPVDVIMDATGAALGASVVGRGRR